MYLDTVDLYNSHHAPNVAVALSHLSFADSFEEAKAAATELKALLEKEGVPTTPTLARLMAMAGVRVPEVRLTVTPAKLRELADRLFANTRALRTVNNSSRWRGAVNPRIGTLNRVISSCVSTVRMDAMVANEHLEFLAKYHYSQVTKQRFIMAARELDIYFFCANMAMHLASAAGAAEEYASILANCQFLTEREKAALDGLANAAKAIRAVTDAPITKTEGTK